MKRIAIALVGLCLLATGANSFWQSRQQVSIGGAPPPTYTGPGDVYTGTWYGYWSVARAFSAAKAGTRLIKLCDHSGGNCTDILTSATTGALLAPTAIGADDCTVLTTCQINTLYENSGAANCGGVACDMITQQFQITFTWNSGKPYAVFDVGIGTYMQPSVQNSALSQSPNGLTVSGVLSNDVSQTSFFVADASFTFQPLQASGSNSMRQYFGAGPNGAASIDGTIQTYQSVANGSSSALVIDGVATTGLASGTNGVNGTNKLTIGGAGSSNAYGKVSEIGIVPVAWTTGGGSQSDLICHNQRIYYGTGGSC